MPDAHQLYQPLLRLRTEYSSSIGKSENVPKFDLVKKQVGEVTTS